MPTPSARLYSAREHGHLIPYIAALHAACISQDQVIATFLPPLHHEKLLGWWKEAIAEAGRGSRLISLLLLLDDDDDDDDKPGPGTGSAIPKGTELVGVVTLSMPPGETAAHRGVVEQLFVSPKYRRRGGARALMAHLEAEALKRGRKLLILDTEAGSTAAQVCPRLGFTQIGMIPAYAISPAGGLRDELFYYKQL
ncbi:acyl-CoA N-acyltransferase [Biscogniauxia sp. FL1348]|nr:acyl-CoA N-acyltransferase [Biscogniauxia sp. FL1348]